MHIKLLWSARHTLGKNISDVGVIVYFHTHYCLLHGQESKEDVKNLRRDYYRPCKQHISKQLVVLNVSAAFWLHYFIQHTYLKKPVDMASPPCNIIFLIKLRSDGP